MSENDLHDGCSVKPKRLWPTEQVMVDYAKAVAMLGFAKVLWGALRATEQHVAETGQSRAVRARQLLRESMTALLDGADHVGAYAHLAAARAALPRIWLDAAVEDFISNTAWLERTKGELYALARS